MSRYLAILGLFALAGAMPASAERFVLAWPPTFYDSAELIIHRGPGSAAGPARVTVDGRGLVVDEWVPETGALRIALPPEARCAVGLDACALVVETELEDLRVVLQSPDTRGVPDTLARTAHDTVRAPAREEAGRRFVVLSAPNSPDFPDAMSFATVVPADGAVGLSASSACTGDVEQRIEPGEVYTLACTGAGEDLSGTLLVADGPIVVFSGNRSAPIPVEAGSGWSADLLMDAPLSLDSLAGGATWVVPPLPRGVAHEGLGDLLRCAAGEALSVRIRDDRGRDETRSLVEGEVLELDSAEAGGDLTFRLDADGALDCWQLSKSRALRGSGDPAALPLVPRELFTTEDVAFAPDGYGDGTSLIVVSESGATVSLDGAPLLGFTPAPGGDLAWSVVDLPEPPSGQGVMLRLSGDAPFGAWLFGQGGYKAHGLTVARARPRPAAVMVLRGVDPQVLEVVAEASGFRWCDAGTGQLLFYEVELDVSLFVDRESATTCLDWSAPGGG